MRPAGQSFMNLNAGSRDADNMASDISRQIFYAAKRVAVGSTNEAPTSTLSPRTFSASMRSTYLSIAALELAQCSVLAQNKNIELFATGHACSHVSLGASATPWPSSVSYAVASCIIKVAAEEQGTIMVFFPSFAYLKEVRDKFVERYPDSVCVSQAPAMDENARIEFLSRFESLEESTLVGFAVMGGIFGEGIDLKGRKLIGVIIAGVGLPQLGIERDVIRDYFEQSGPAGQGFEFAYQYPGMNRVLQTAGRVIRSETDRGIICLVDNRFNESRYRRLMPTQWQVKLSRNREILGNAVAAFWADDDRNTP